MEKKQKTIQGDILPTEREVDPVRTGDNGTKHKIKTPQRNRRAEGGRTKKEGRGGPDCEGGHE